MWFWTAVGLLVAIYGIATGIMFLRQRRYVSSTVGLTLGVLILFMPVAGRTHAVEIDLPAASPR